MIVSICEGFISTKFRKNNILAKITEFTVGKETTLNICQWLLIGTFKV